MMIPNSSILGIDLGKFNSVLIEFDPVEMIGPAAV